MFFMDLIGNRLIIAVIASLHVMINHPLAVGAYPLVTLMEWYGYRHNNLEWDRLAYKITFVLFIVTTSIGALTGVGIWLTTALISPFGIGSLLRIFFWAWFGEWLVFVTEVILILIYFLTWKKWIANGLKKLHIGVGAALSIFSWFTMVIIVAILGFMMGSGTWPKDHTFFSAIFNPLYFPQLAFRTTFALIMAGFFFWFLLFFFTDKGSELRRKAMRFMSIWILVLIPPFAAASAWYWHRIPKDMAANIDVGLLTQRFMQWHETLAVIMVVAVGVVILFSLIGALRPRLLPGIALIIPFIVGAWLLGHFERVREFIRKPYVVADYMYSNGVQVDDLPIFQRDGILTYSTFVKNHRVTEQNKREAGRDVFMVACSRCHTTKGLNGMTSKFSLLYGDEKPWDENAMNAFIHTMHSSRTYMPPFPGNDKEAEALITYIKSLQFDHEYILDGHTGWTVPDYGQSAP